MFCAKCGKKIPFWAKFCAKCGGGVSDTSTGGIRVLRYALLGLCVIIVLSIAGAYWATKSSWLHKETVQKVCGIALLASVALILILSVIIIIIRAKRIVLTLIHRPALGGFCLANLIALVLVIYFGFFHGPSSSLKVAVVKGPVSGASVSIYELKDNGDRGKLIDGPRTSDGSGIVNFTYLSNLPKRLIIEAKGGWYVSEASGLQIKLKDTDVFTAVLPAGVKGVAVTPFTHMAAALARAKIQGGQAPDTAVISANEDVAKQYGLKSILDIPSKGDQYSLALGGFAQLSQNLGVRDIDLAEALARDWSDGKADGRQNGAAVVVVGGKALGSAGTAGLTDATTQFVKSGKKASSKEITTTVNPPVTAVPAGLHITTTSLPAWVSGQSGSFTITAEGGSLPLHWSVKSGSLPAGFSLSQDGILSGSYILPSGVTKKIFEPFTAEAKDQKGQTKTVELSITVVPEAPSISTYNPPTLIVGQSYDEKIATADGGMLPYKFGNETASGPIPMGMQITAVGNQAHLVGSPKAKGNFSFRVCVIDSADTSKCGEKVAFEVKEEEIAPLPAPTTAPAPKPTVTGGKWDGTYRGVCTLTGSQLLRDNSCDDDQRIYCPPYFFWVTNDYIWSKGAHRSTTSGFTKLVGGDIDFSGATTIHEATSDTTSDYTLQFYLDGDEKYVKGTLTRTRPCSYASPDYSVYQEGQCTCTYSLSGGPATAR